MQTCVLPAIFVFLAIIGYYINYVNNYIHENEIRLYKMNYNINANWYDCTGLGAEFDMCKKCMEGTEVATEIYEHLSNNMFGDLKIYCRKDGILHKAPIYDEYNYVYNLSPGPTAMIQTINEEYNEQYEDANDAYIEYVPQGRPVLSR